MYLRLLLGAIGLCACTASADPQHAEAPADSVAGELPFRYTGPNEAAMIVPVHINGNGPYDFVVDTGATLTCIDEALRARLDLPAREGAMSLGAGIGGAGRFAVAEVDTFRIGPASATRLPVCVLNLEQFRSLGFEIHGLVGLNVLKQFRVSIDFERQILTLQEATSAKAAR